VTPLIFDGRREIAESVAIVFFVHPVPTDGLNRLLFFLDDRLAQLRWSREDLGAAGGPVPATLRSAVRRGGGLSRRSLARLDYALGWQEGSASRVLAGGSPSVRISDLLTASSAMIDATRQEAQCAGIGRCAAELRNFLLDVAHRLEDFYTEPVGAVRGGADACRC